MAAVYTNAKYLMATDSLGWVNPARVFRCLLVTAAYTFNAAHTMVADIQAHEVAGGTYARQDVLSRIVQADPGGARALLRAASTRFPGLVGVTPAGAIIYRQEGGNDNTPGNDPLVAHFGFAATPTAGLDLMIEYSTDGVVALTAC